LVRLSIATLAATTVSGCAKPRAAPAATAPTIASVQVFPASLDLTSGESAQLQAQANDSSGAPVGGAGFTFVADDTTLLAIDAVGHVLARGPVGRTRVWVRSGTARIEVPVRVRAGPPSQLRFVPDATLRVVAGEPAATPVSVQLQDAAGNPVSAAVLRFSIGGAPYGHEAATAEDGTATWLPEAPTRAGPTTISAETALEPRLETRLDVIVDAGAVAELRDAPGIAEAAQDAAVDLLGSVRALDGFQNPVPSTSVEWQLTRGCGEILHADATTAANGVASIGIATPARPARKCTLTARVSGSARETIVSLRGPVQQ
jgi:hypothetical protein